jgi:hypothetical protein
MRSPSSSLVDFVDQRVNLPHPRRIDPVRESPRSMMFGSFTYRTVHLTDLTHPAFCLSPTVFAGRLPRHTPSPGFWSRGFRRASGTIRPSDDSQGTASHFACPYRVASLGATRGSWELSWGHAQIFRTVPSANTLVRWVNENAFAPIVRARPCPTFGRPVLPWGSPHRLRPGTSPHTLPIPPRDGHPVLQARRAVASGRSCLYPAFAFVPQETSPYFPLTSASEALPPLLDTALLTRAPEGLQPS